MSIQLHVLEIREDLEDQFYWKRSSSGAFTVKSALKIIRIENDLADIPLWSSLWSSIIPNNMKFFVWLVTHGRIMCNEVRMKRHLVDSPSCSICHNSCESVLHLMRDCPSVSSIWKQLCSTSTLQWFFNELDVQQWVNKNLKVSNSWALLFSIVIWWCWKWRNMSVFERAQTIPVDQVNFIRDKYHEIQHVMQLDMAEFRHSVKKEILVKCLPPHEGWVVLNTDGATKGAKGTPGLAGGGGVLRDHYGHVLTRFAANFGCCTAIRAELLALLKGIQVAWERKIPLLDIRVDNWACVQLILQEEQNIGPHCQLIKQCKELILNSQWKVRLMHCLREANMAADYLANLGVLQNEAFKVVHPMPLALSRIISHDLLGVAWPRLVSM